MLSWRCWLQVGVVVPSNRRHTLTQAHKNLQGPQLSLCSLTAAHFPLGVCTAVKLGGGQRAGGIQMHSCRAEP